MEFPCYMMATKAIHKLADISRTDPDYCCIQEKTDDGYIGSWIEGYGFINVLFPFETTRECTAEELEYVATKRVVIIT